LLVNGSVDRKYLITYHHVDVINVILRHYH